MHKCTNAHLSISMELPLRWSSSCLCDERYEILGVCRTVFPFLADLPRISFLMQHSRECHGSDTTQSECYERERERMTLRSWKATALSAAALLLLLCSLTTYSTASNNNNNFSPFSSNVVALTSRNWRSLVEESPHAVFVNICRSG